MDNKVCDRACATQTSGPVLSGRTRWRGLKYRAVRKGVSNNSQTLVTRGWKQQKIVRKINVENFKDGTFAEYF